MGPETGGGSILEEPSRSRGVVPAGVECQAGCPGQGGGIREQTREGQQNILLSNK